MFLTWWRSSDDHREKEDYSSITEKDFLHVTENMKVITHLILSSSIIRSCLSLRRTSKILSLSRACSKLKSIYFNNGLWWSVTVTGALLSVVLSAALSSFCFCLLLLCSLTLPLPATRLRPTVQSPGAERGKDNNVQSIHRYTKISPSPDFDLLWLSINVGIRYGPCQQI